MSFDPETVMAFVDGELDMLTARRIELAMVQDAALADEVRRQRALRERLAARFDPLLDEPVPERLGALLSNLDTSLAARREARTAPGWGRMQWGALAASLVLGLLIGRAGLDGPQASIGEQQGVLVAQGALGEALETQLASAQGSDPAIRIGLTFRDRQGAVCRSFTQPSAAGVGCREADGDWRLRALVPGQEAASEYRQASSDEMMRAVEQMIAGDAFDADAEAAARDTGWR